MWDTALAAHALMEAGEPATSARRRGLDWLVPLQVLDVVGDWAATRPRRASRRLGVPVRQSALPRPRRHRRGGRWPWTARAASAPATRYDEAIARGAEWVEGLQSSNGGWAAFDADNTYYYLNNIPFADHGALLDPPTEDVTARCVSHAGAARRAKRQAAVMPAASPICATSSWPDGSWYGRWGINYIYGTWSALCALNACGVDSAAPDGAQGGRLADRHPERRRRLGRGRHSYWLDYARP